MKSSTLNFLQVTLYCNGRKWNATLPNCTRPDVPPPTRCTFDNGDYCGWTQSSLDQLDWTVVNGNMNATTADTGIGVNPFSSHILHFESSGSSLDDSAAIFSPVYHEQRACFAFQFGMNGANMGSLSLYIVPEGQDDLTGQSPVITFQGNHGHHWILWTIFLDDNPLIVQGRFFQMVLLFDSISTRFVV